MFITPVYQILSWNLMPEPGVYFAMFEESLLPDQTGVRKLTAISASFSAQIVLAGVLLLAPLLYHETLAIHLTRALEYHPISPAAPTQPVRASTATASSALASRRPLQAPSRVQFDISRIYSPAVIDAPGFDLSPASTNFAPRAGDVILPQLAPPPKPISTAQSAAEPPALPANPVRVSEGVLAAQLIRKVVPAYPVLAKQARVQGTVHLIGIIGRDGTVQNLRVVSGHPLLVDAALAAVRQWLYRPVLLNGEPVEVTGAIDINFTLQ